MAGGFDLMTLLRKGQDPSHITGLPAPFRTALSGLIGGAPENMRQGLSINSGFRTPERQKELFDAAVAKYGSPEAARKWVAPPGQSRHQTTGAVDLGFGSPQQRDWFHKNAPSAGLVFPMKHEPWHVQMANQPSPTNQGILDPLAAPRPGMMGSASSAGLPAGPVASPTMGTSSPAMTQPMPQIADSAVPQAPTPEPPKGFLEKAGDFLGTDKGSAAIGALAKAFGGGGGGGSAPQAPQARAPQIAPSNIGATVGQEIAAKAAQAGPMLQGILSQPNLMEKLRQRRPGGMPPGLLG